MDSLSDGAPEQPRVQSEPSAATRRVLPHDAILQESVKHIGLPTLSRPGPGISSYIPTAFNMFAMLEVMCDKLDENDHVHNICPGFFTPVLYLYYSHVVYFHILRARAFAGRLVLTRSEELILSQYERVAPAESWPVAGPLIGFIQAMGAHKPEDSYYSWIVPSLPNFNFLQEGFGLAGLEEIPGMQRLPVVPALQKLVHNFGTGAADFKDGILQPVALPLSDDNDFIGIVSAGVGESLLAITSNLCWKTPSETGDDFFVDTGAKRRHISRWNVPDVPNNATLNTAELFLGLAPNQSVDWMKHLLNTATSISRFFPNSTTLSGIPPSTSLGSLTDVEYICVPRYSSTAVEDTWYYGRPKFTLKFKGFLKPKDGLLDIKLGIAASTNADFTGHLADGFACASPGRKGPFFRDDTQAEKIEKLNAPFLSGGFSRYDPATRYAGLISKPEYFDATGGSMVN